MDEKGPDKGRSATFDARKMGKFLTMTLFFFENSKQNHQLRINGQEKLEVKESVEWWENSEKGRFRKKQQK